MALLNRPMGWQRVLQRLAATRLGAWIFSRTLHHIDPWVIRWSRGRLSIPAIFIGTPTLLVTTIGAKSGLPRTHPLVALRDADVIILIASNWGRLHHPAWYHNIRAHPQVQVSIGGHIVSYIAHEATGAVYARYWQAAVELYCGYAAYKDRAGNRPIPIIVLTPQL